MARRKLVFLVDPREEQCRRVGEALESVGYQVMAMADADAAASVLPYAEADLVLTAHPLVGDDGVAFSQRVKRVLPRMLVVGMLERVDRDLVRHALTGGCDDYLPKPLDLELLTAKLARLIGPADSSWPEQPI